jgi:hypothetical protein
LNIFNNDTLTTENIYRELIDYCPRNISIINLSRKNLVDDILYKYSKIQQIVITNRNKKHGFINLKNVGCWYPINDEEPLNEWIEYYFDSSLLYEDNCNELFDITNEELLGQIIDQVIEQCYDKKFKINNIKPYEIIIRCDNYINSDIIYQHINFNNGTIKKLNSNIQYCDMDYTTFGNSLDETTDLNFIVNVLNCWLSDPKVLLNIFHDILFMNFNIYTINNIRTDNFAYDINELICRICDKLKIRTKHITIKDDPKKYKYNGERVLFIDNYNKHTEAFKKLIQENNDVVIIRHNVYDAELIVDYHKIEQYVDMTEAVRTNFMSMENFFERTHINEIILWIIKYIHHI